MDSLLDRLNNAYNHLLSKGVVHTKSGFAKMLGVAPSQITDAFRDRNRRLTIGMMQRIAESYPRYINREYMLTGEGSVDAESMEESMFNKARPHITDTSVAAGFMSGIAENGNVTSEVCTTVPKYDFSINVSGDSMTPEICPGDTVFCRIVTNRYEDVKGKICVIDSSEGGLVKVIKNDEGDSLVLHSFNPQFPDYEISKSDIYQIARVVGISRQY